jgi:hypothetical protein
VPKTRPKNQEKVEFLSALQAELSSAGTVGIWASHNRIANNMLG